MPSRDGADQQRVSGATRPGDQDQAEARTGDDLAARKEQLDADVDGILDEIDEVLEENAEDFVKSFVQKGGE